MSAKMKNSMRLKEDTQDAKYLLFLLGDETYGIDICNVMEIIKIQIITGMPQLPSYIKGIINLRGKIIPVVDVRIRFGKKYRTYDERTCIIVTEMNNAAIGFIVDRVTEVITIPDENIVLPPNFRDKQKDRYIKGIGKIGNQITLLIDCEKILSERDQDNGVESID